MSNPALRFGLLLYIPCDEGRDRGFGCLVSPAVVEPILGAD
jgi:hypothetical protein